MVAADAKEILMKIKEYDVRIANKTEDIERITDMITKITVAWREDVVSGGNKDHDKIGAAVAKLIDIKESMISDIDSYVKARELIMEALNSIKNPYHFDVLYKRYVLYKKWETISEEMNYKDVRGVYKLHGKALRTFSKVYNH